MLQPVRISAPSIRPVELEELRQHCRIDAAAEEDALLGIYLDSAVSILDGYSGSLGRCLINQVWRVDLGCWPVNRRVAFRFPDVSSVSVSYQDAGGSQESLPNTEYWLEPVATGTSLVFSPDAALPELYSVQRPDRVSVSMHCGYGATADAVPMALRLAVMMLAAHFYEHREAAVVGNGLSVNELPLGVQRLIAPFRVLRI